MPAGATQGATSIEVYGFTAWITTGVAYGAFLCWAYIPERYLQALGISYYPDKYWALAVPSWVCVAVVAAYWAYESWNESLVPPLESLNNIQDAHSKSPANLGLPILSLSAFYKSATHPYVIDKTKKCAKPILVLMLVTLFVSQLLAVPIRAIALAVQVVTLGLVSSNVASVFGQRWVSDAVASAPMVIMLVVRSFVRKPLYKCFIHMLREVNPQTAQVIETTPRISNPNKKTKTVKVNEKVDKTYQRAVNMLALSAGLYICRQIPLFGRLVAPVMHYLTMNKNLGPRRAAIMSLVALYSPVEPCVIKFVEVWRASRILAPEILDPYLSHTIPHQDRAAFFRQNEVTINAFLAPQEVYLSGQGNPQPGQGGFQAGQGSYQTSAGNYQDSVHSHKYS
ncbi:hypothetical protein WJX79_008135 [Trebouxia sp. C0005]